MFHQIQPHSAQFPGMIGSPQLHLLDGFSLFFKHRQQLGAGPGQKFRLQRNEFFVNELIDHAQDRLHFVGHCKIHITSQLHFTRFATETCCKN